jgi:hypothetical protein|nr:twin-arginine translocation signal domain-containing protein [Caldimonas sp.]
MKSLPSSLDPRADVTDSAPTSRRRLVVGAGAAAGAALAAAAIQRKVEPKAQVAGTKTDATPATGGYRLTDHVRRYYETTRA